MAKRKEHTCVLFYEIPEGTHYRKGAYSWVSNSTADEYIDEGYGVEYDPYNNEIEEPEILEEEE